MKRTATIFVSLEKIDPAFSNAPNGASISMASFRFLFSINPVFVLRSPHFSTVIVISPLDVVKNGELITQFTFAQNFYKHKNLHELKYPNSISTKHFQEISTIQLMTDFLKIFRKIPDIISKKLPTSRKNHF